MAQVSPTKNYDFTAGAFCCSRAIVLALFCALALCALSAAAPAIAEPIGPHWNASQIVAQHPDTTEALIASYRRVRTGGEPAGEKVLLGIAPDYAYSDDASQRLVVDAKLQRIISIDLASGSFRHDSIYSAAGFVEYETRNRLVIGEVLRRAGATEDAPPSNFDTFWIESDMGVIVEDQPRPEIDVTENRKAIAFSYGGIEVVTATFSEQTLSGEQLNRFRNLLRLLTKLHPAILEQIVATGKLPRTLSFRMPRNPDVITTTYTLESARTEVIPFPLVPDAPRKFTGNHPFYVKMLPVMEAAVAGVWQPGSKSRDEYFSQIRDAANRSAWFEALMLQTELSLLIADQSGGCTDELESMGHCISLNDFAADLMRDDRVRSYIQGQQIQDTEPVRAVETWRGIPVQDLPNNYLMGVFIGNVVSTHLNAFETAPADPYAMFTAAIAANPYVSSFYKDLGDHFRRQLEFGLAWICYDLGRALPNRPTGDVLEHVDQIESYLRQRVPQLF